MSPEKKHQHHYLKSKKNGCKACFAFLLIMVLLTSCNPYGENVTLLYHVNDYPAGFLIWSPSGKQLAFSSNGAINGSVPMSSIYTLDIESKKAQLLIKPEYGILQTDAWTPDGNELVFNVSSSRNYEDGIWKMEINGFDLPTPLLYENVSFAWSYTNMQAIGRRIRAGVFSVSIRDVETGFEFIALQKSGGLSSPFSWSGDGSKVAFNSFEDDLSNRNIFVYDLRTQDTQQLTLDGANNSPSLSPNGNQVAYVKDVVSKKLNYNTFHIVNSDGTCDIEVPGLIEIGSLAWSPDGRYIAFVGRGNKIYLLDIFKTFGEEFLETGSLCK